MNNDAESKEVSVVIYTRKERQVVIPAMANNHWSKNPFLRLPLRRNVAVQKAEQNSDNDSVAEESQGFVVRCLSGFKSALKFKDWRIVKVPQPSNHEDSAAPSVGTSEESRRRSGESSGTSHEDERLEPWPSSFVDEVQTLRASLEFRNKATPDICRNFKIIRDLPFITEDEIHAKRVSFSPPYPRLSDKTLLLDLDHTLLVSMTNKPEGNEKGKKHWHKLSYFSSLSNGRQVRYARLRPHAKHFLAELRELYEIVVFTAAEAEYATAILDKILDPQLKFIDHVLTREHCLRKGAHYVKDLRIVENRELAKMVLLDNSIVAFCTLLDNGILISSYLGADEDAALLPALDFLKQHANEPDIRAPIRNTFLLSDLYRVYLKEHTSRPFNPGI